MKSLLKDNRKMKTSLNKFVVFGGANAISGDILIWDLWEVWNYGNYEISSGDITLIKC